MGGGPNEENDDDALNAELNALNAADDQKVDNHTSNDDFNQPSQPPPNYNNIKQPSPQPQPQPMPPSNHNMNNFNGQQPMYQQPQQPMYNQPPPPQQNQNVSGQYFVNNGPNYNYQ